MVTTGAQGVAFKEASHIRKKKKKDWEDANPGSCRDLGASLTARGASPISLLELLLCFFFLFFFLLKEITLEITLKWTLGDLCPSNIYLTV